MSLSIYHQNYQKQNDEKIQHKADEKERELDLIFEKVTVKTDSVPARIAVLGCGDKRLVKHHKRIFEKVLERKVEIITFDVTIDHLEGETNVIKHDCTLPLPNTPYDITYAHVLLKFIKTKKQFDLLKNSYDALKSGGIAIHVFDKEEIETEAPSLPDGLYSVPLKSYQQKMDSYGIEYIEIPLKYGIGLVLLKK